MLVLASACVSQSIHPEAVKHHDLGIEHLARGQCVQAEERCRLALEYGPGFQHPHNCLGLVALECRRDLDAAAQHFKDAIALDADFAEAHNNLGTTFFRRDPPDYETACEQFRAALGIDPAYLDARENLGLCLLRRGTVSGTLGDLDARAEHYAEARSHFVRLLELSPGHADAHHHLGYMDLEEQRWRSAEEHFRDCLELAPDNPYCSYNLGYVYLETARCEDAIRAFVAALASETATEVAIGARQNLGVAYELCAREDQAISSMLDAMQRNPGDARAHFDLGRLYARKGQSQRAAAEWTYASRLDPSFCGAAAALADQALTAGDEAATAAWCAALERCVERSRGDRAADTEDVVARCRARAVPEEAASTSGS
jgi:tetratricopeptide (TPR) repeat protein